MWDFPLVTPLATGGPDVTAMRFLVFTKTLLALCGVSALLLVQVGGIHWLARLMLPSAGPGECQACGP